MNNQPKTSFSYEFFPPRSVQMQRRLWRAIGQLERLRPSFFSMTYGALGSAQNVSIDTAIAMYRDSPVEVAAHLTCCNASRQQVDAVAWQFHDAGIRRLSVVDLIGTLRGFGDTDISVAAYPETHPRASSALADLQQLKRKLDAGAQRAITQYFFDAECFLRFRDQARRRGIDKPIIPGILPVHDLDKIRVFSERCGATVPDYYHALFAKVKNQPEAQYRLALELAVELCERLTREGVDSFHFYTLNQTDMCLDISLALGASLQGPQLTSAA
jgi:methylenetetrahydrofolate reductase (NADPH)